MGWDHALGPNRRTCDINHGLFGSPTHHYNDVMMSTMASQITSLPIVYSTVYSSANQRKHQSSASLAFLRGIHRWPVNSPHKGPVTWKMFPFDGVIMYARYQASVSWFNKVYTGITGPEYVWMKLLRSPSMGDIEPLTEAWRSDFLSVGLDYVFLCSFHAYIWRSEGYGTKNFIGKCA